MTITFKQKMESFTTEEFQLHFDELLERVESGESFIIRGDYGNCVIVPCQENECEEIDDLIRVHTNHGDGC